MGKLCCSVTCAVIGLLSIIFGCVVFFVFDPVAETIIQKKLVLREDSDFFKNWAEPQITYRRVYFFNVTNADQYMRRGGHPNLVEVGPYTYRVKWLKTNINFLNNETIYYNTVPHYYFDRDASVGPESDIITTLSIPVMVAANTAVRTSNRYIRERIAQLLNGFHVKAFVKKNVRDLLWGYEDVYIDITSSNGNHSFKMYGYFTEINGTLSSPYNVFSGERDMQDLGMIKSYNDSYYLDFWHKKPCDNVKGSDGTLFPPGIKKETRLYQFKEDFCRSLPLTYEEDVEQNGINGYRFTPPADVFDLLEDTAEEKCMCQISFHHLRRQCFHKRGLSDISLCRYQPYSYISWPHFYQAGRSLRDAVTGLNPDKMKHQYYIDVSPLTGVTFSARARIQINFLTFSVPGLPAVRNIGNVFLPVIWYEDGFNSIPQETTELLQSSSSLPQIVKLSMLLVFFILGGLFLLLATVRILKQKCHKSSQKSDIKMSSSPQYPEQVFPNGFQKIQNDDTVKQID